MDIVYKDIDMTFGKTITNDIAKKTNENAIKQSIKNIVLTKDKLFFPNFGTNVYNFLFENMDSLMLQVLKDDIRNSIRYREKRVDRVTCEVNNSQIDQHVLVIDIYFTIREIKEIYNVSVMINKIK